MGQNSENISAFLVICYSFNIFLESMQIVNLFDLESFLLRCLEFPVKYLKNKLTVNFTLNLHRILSL